MKLGLGQSYDRVQYLPVKLRGYIDLTKPASSVGVGLGYVLASLFFFAYTYEGGRVWVEQAGQELFSIMFVSATIFLAHSASQAFNMAEDADMDRETPHKQDRPIPSGVVTEDEARTLALILSGMAIWRAFWVDKMFGGFVLVLLFFGIFYNLSPIRAKEKIISIPWQAASRGLLMFPAVWSAYGNPFTPTPWILGLFAFFYVMGFQNSADIIDRTVDEKYGIRTFIVEFGVNGTIKIMYGCTVAMVAVVVGSVYTGLLEESMIILLAIIPFCLWMVHYMKTKPYEVSDTTGNHPAWLWFYGGMVALVALPLIAEGLF